jgi:hypothetical protein
VTSHASIPPITSDEILLRRLSSNAPHPLISTDKLTGDVRPSSAAFKINPKRDPDGLSVFRNRVLVANSLAADAVRDDPKDLIAAVTADVVIGQTLSVEPDPLPDDPAARHPRRGRAHALLTGWPAGTNARSKIAAALSRASQIVSA